MRFCQSSFIVLFIVKIPDFDVSIFAILDRIVNVVEHLLDTAQKTQVLFELLFAYF